VLADAARRFRIIYADYVLSDDIAMIAGWCPWLHTALRCALDKMKQNHWLQQPTCVVIKSKDAKEKK